MAQSDDAIARQLIPVAFAIGWLIVVLATAMLLPMAIALWEGQMVVFQAFAVSASGLLFLAGALILSVRGRGVVASRAQALQLTILIWIVLPPLAAMPFLLSGSMTSYLAAYFEAMSGFTTTGATLKTTLYDVPRAVLVWRAQLEWLGGLATLLCLLLMTGPVTKIGGMDGQMRLISHRRGSEQWHMAAAFRTIPLFYAGMTVACIGALLFSGIPAFDALCLGLSTVSTGGFMPRDGSVELYGSQIALIVLTIFMLAGAASIVWVRSLLGFRWAELSATREPLLIALVVLIVGGGLCGSLLSLEAASGLRATFDRLLLGVTTAASLVSTTGFSISERTDATLPYILLVGLCIVGGGTFSTAGGLKYARLVALAQDCSRELNSLVYPHGVQAGGLKGSPQELATSRLIWTNLGVLLASLSTLTLVLAAGGLDLPAAILAAVAAISNIGPAYLMSVDGGAAGNLPFAEMPGFAQLALCAGMLIGRIEVLALLSLFNFAYWRS